MIPYSYPPSSLLPLTLALILSPTELLLKVDKKGFISSGQINTQTHKNRHTNKCYVRCCNVFIVDFDQVLIQWEAFSLRDAFNNPFHTNDKFLTPLKLLKTTALLKLSGDIEMEQHWRKMG